MDKNTFLAIFLSTTFLLVWFMFFQPKQQPVTAPEQAAAATVAEKKAAQPQTLKTPAVSAGAECPVPERDITVETNAYKAVFTNRGGAIKHWYLKENNGALVDLVLDENSSALTTFPGSNFDVEIPELTKVVFKHRSPLGWQIIKTYEMSETYLHKLTIQTSKTRRAATLPTLDIPWGPGLGTDIKELKENLSQTRALGYKATLPLTLEKFKPGDYPAKLYNWTAIDNRYFLAALIPSRDSAFTNIGVSKASKNYPPIISISAAPAAEAQSQTCSLMFYLGPKGHEHLKSLNMGLEDTVDFGYFGFLGKLALAAVSYLHRITGNYGWAIIILTVLLGVLTFPLTMKSFKASAAMKQLQPLVKDLQVKYKEDPKRLNVEMLNLYKVHKVNPLGGCLPMLLQLPIFWALFTTLRNAFELRGAHWIFWIKDLSAPDTLLTVASIPLNVLPLIMGIGMFFQQKMMAVSTDPAQEKMMYLMPVIFTFMFWNFPSGLVIYWLTNSILTMVEQYFIMKNQPALVVSGK